MKLVTLDIPNAQPHQFVWAQPCDYRKTLGVNLLVKHTFTAHQPGIHMKQRLLLIGL